MTDKDYCKSTFIGISLGILLGLLLGYLATVTA